MALSIDYGYCCEPAIPGGVRADEWDGLQQWFGRAHAAAATQERDGVLGFLQFETQDAELQRVLDYAQARRGTVDDVVVLGIGGSALGPIALRTALLPAGWNLLDRAERQGTPRLHVLDNVDPRSIAALLARLDLSRSLFIVTSKSGGTAETLAQYLIVRARLLAAGLPVHAHFAFVTDPSRGALRQIAARDGITAFAVPENVGGRFSVFSPVGTLPGALAGMDVRAFREGARAMRDRCRASALTANPAGLFALLHWRAHQRAGQGTHVLMPYSDALRDVAPWFVQLWAESLGKTDADGLPVGPTPLAALGATDQHAQVQLFVEGPRDKTVTFVAVATAEPDLVIPPLEPAVGELAYLGGRSLHELLEAERLATARALAKVGRPSMTITLERADAWHLGGLFCLLGLATVYAGTLYRVNPLDQPGVEQGKRFACHAFGRAGYESVSQELAAVPAPDPRHRV